MLRNSSMNEKKNPLTLPINSLKTCDLVVCTEASLYRSTRRIMIANHRFNKGENKWMWANTVDLMIAVFIQKPISLQWRFFFSTFQIPVLLVSHSNRPIVCRDKVLLFGLNPNSALDVRCWYLLDSCDVFYSGSQKFKPSPCVLFCNFPKDFLQLKAFKKSVICRYQTSLIVIQK